MEEKAERQWGGDREVSTLELAMTSARHWEQAGILEADCGVSRASCPVVSLAGAFGQS
jgi:hypothetical protein